MKLTINIKGINGHEGYFIGENGEVYKQLKPWKTNSGYLHTKIEGKHYDVHRIVATHFVDGDKSLTVNHIDGCKENNNASNLEWITRGDNVRKYIENGGTPIKNFTNCKLYYNDELIAECQSIKEACRIARDLGASFTMLEKHRENRGFKIVKC